MNPIDVSIFKGYVPVLLSANKSIRQHGIKSLKYVLSSLLDKFIGNKEIIELKDLIKTIENDNSKIQELVNKISSEGSYKKFIEIMYERGKLMLNASTESIKKIPIDGDLELVIEYIFTKGIIIKESWSDNPQCRIKLKKCRVYKYQLFHIPEMVIEILEYNNDKLWINANNINQEISDGEVIKKSDKFSITAIWDNDCWNFEGNFFKFLHNTQSIANQESSPNILLPENLPEETLNKIFIGQKRLTIKL